MDSTNPLNPYSDSPSYSYLLHSQNFHLNSPKPTKPTGSSKRKAGEECSVTSSTTVGDEEVRPEGVKAAKARRKVGQGKSLADVTTVMEMKERLSKLAILDTLLAKTGTLSEAEEIVKNKLLAQYF
ncbi:hypothetical protein Bca52824_025991 [Brassica carinata]|uniref:No apical meristem-associated C-terminal domain-containing protein n=1 Tax=Brassica carinata TaxID=52824 RepID=A0A8X7SH60_BRACI|nr:hypothetical protein Bca52824_025991 [Brassica carinata]